MHGIINVGETVSVVTYITLTGAACLVLLTFGD